MYLRECGELGGNTIQSINRCILRSGKKFRVATGPVFEGGVAIGTRSTGKNFAVLWEQPTSRWYLVIRSLAFACLWSPLPYCVRIGLCDQ